MRNNSERRAKAWEIVTALLSHSPFLPIFSLFSLTPLFPMETLQINLHQKCLPYRLSKEVTKNGMNQVSILWRFYGSWFFGEQCDAGHGESTHLPPMCPGFKSRRRRQVFGLGLLFVLSIALRGFTPGT